MTTTHPTPAMGKTFFNPISRAVFPLLAVFLLPVCTLLGSDLQVGEKAPDLTGFDEKFEIRLTNAIRKLLQ